MQARLCWAWLVVAGLVLEAGLRVEAQDEAAAAGAEAGAGDTEEGEEEAWNYVAFLKDDIR